MSDNQRSELSPGDIFVDPNTGATYTWNGTNWIFPPSQIPFPSSYINIPENFLTSSGVNITLSNREEFEPFIDSDNESLSSPSRDIANNQESHPSFVIKENGKEDNILNLLLDQSRELAKLRGLFIQVSNDISLAAVALERIEEIEINPNIKVLHKALANIVSHIDETFSYKRIEPKEDRFENILEEIK